MFVMMDKTRKKRGQNILFHWKDCLFFENLCFQQPLRTWRNALVSSAVIVKLACWPSQIVSWGLSQSMMRGKMGQKPLSSWKQLFWKYFFSTDFLGTKERILSFAQYLSQITSCALTSCSLTFVMFNKMGKTRPNSFLHWKDCLFFKNLCFQQPLSS